MDSFKFLLFGIFTTYIFAVINAAALSTLPLFTDNEPNDCHAGSSNTINNVTGECGDKAFTKFVRDHRTFVLFRRSIKYCQTKLCGWEGYDPVTEQTKWVQSNTCVCPPTHKCIRTFKQPIKRTWEYTCRNNFNPTDVELPEKQWEGLP